VTQGHCDVPSLHHRSLTPAYGAAMLHSGDLRRPRYRQDLQVGARPPHGSVRSLHGRSDPAKTLSLEGKEVNDT